MIDLDRLLLDITTGTDQQRINAKSRLREIARLAEPNQPQRLDHHDTSILRGTILRFTKNIAPHIEKGDYGLVMRNQDRRDIHGREIELLVAAKDSTGSQETFPTVIFNETDAPDLWFPFETVDPATQALIALWMRAQILDNRMGDTDATPDGSDYNTLHSAIKDAAKSLTR